VCLQSSSDEEASDEKATFSKNAYCTVKANPKVRSNAPSPKTHKLNIEKTLEIISKIRKKIKNENLSNSFYLRISVGVPPDLPGNQQYRKLVPLPHQICQNPNMCYIAKDANKDWKVKARNVLAETDIEIYGLGEYRKLTKGALKRRKFIQHFDLILADPCIRNDLL